MDIFDGLAEVFSAVVGTVAEHPREVAEVVVTASVGTAAYLLGKEAGREDGRKDIQPNAVV